MYYVPVGVGSKAADGAHRKPQVKVGTRLGRGEAEGTEMEPPKDGRVWINIVFPGGQYEMN